MYRYRCGDEARRDIVGGAFTVVGVENPDRRDLKAHLLRRLAGMSVATL